MFLSEPLTIWDLLAGTDKERPGCSKTQSDQMRSYYPTGRSSRKWYRYIFWFLFDVVIGNAFVLDKMSATGRRRPKMGLEF